MDFFRKELEALAAKWANPDWWAKHGAHMDSKDCADELKALLRRPKTNAENTR